MRESIHVNQPTLPAIDLSLDALVDDAVRLLRQAAPEDGKVYRGCFSGGKDSCAIKELCRLAGVRVEWHYSVTTIDPPELVRFIRRQHSDVVLDRPEKNFFTYAIENKHGFPTRRMRWCCAVYKERRSPEGARLVLGVRAAESPRRAKNWREVTFHNTTHEYAVAPIVRWQDHHVWEFIQRQGLAYCCLYDEGFTRLGCIGCPMAREAGRLREFARWPGFER